MIAKVLEVEQYTNLKQFLQRMQFKMNSQNGANKLDEKSNPPTRSI